MRKFILFWCMAILLLDTGWVVALDASDENPEKGTLKVVITGMQNEKGDVIVALFSSKESFEGNGPEFQSVRVEISGKRSECEFSNIPFGVYAVKVFHDENGNGKLDKNAMGQPRERYGFSNNVRNLFGPAGYSEAKFSFEKVDMVIGITLK
ncbi:MAG: DUF2141 domain-containing protein [Syntrophobacterales bacterium]|nr:DUF2141 domain-containing protein [Syntrophobacterales bacterium]